MTATEGESVSGLQLALDDTPQVQNYRWSSVRSFSISCLIDWYLSPLNYYKGDGPGGGGETGPVGL
jgi:hypothetical protein